VVRRKVDVRREEILAAAVEEVQSRGFAATRVSDVAKALGVSPALVFYHFETKDKLLAAALQQAVERDLARLDATVARGRTPVDQVRGILRLYAPQGDAPGWTLWVDAWAEALRSKEMQDVARGLDHRWKETLAVAIRSGNADGTFRCADPDATAWRLTALLDGLAVQVTVTHNLTRAQLSRWVREAAASELGVPAQTLA
jgi:AcrR family transcriptional regulator